MADLTLNVKLIPDGVKNLASQIENSVGRATKGTSAATGSTSMQGNIKIQGFGKLLAGITGIAGVAALVASTLGELLQGPMKMITTLLKITLLPIAMIITGIMFTVFKTLAPLVKIWLLMWLPFQRRMFKGIGDAFDKGGGFVQALGSILTTVAEFTVVSFSKVVAELAKAIINQAATSLKFLLTALGIIAVILTKVFAAPDKKKDALIKTTSVFGLLADAAVNTSEEQNKNQLKITQVANTFAKAIGGVEIVSNAAKTAIDILSDDFISAFIDFTDVSSKASESLGFVNDALIGIAGAFDETFAGALTVSLTAATKFKDTMIDIKNETIPAKDKLALLAKTVKNAFTIMDNAGIAFENTIAGEGSVSEAIKNALQLIQNSTSAFEVAVNTSVNNIKKKLAEIASKASSNSIPSPYNTLFTGNEPTLIEQLTGTSIAPLSGATVNNNSINMNISVNSDKEVAKKIFREMHQELRSRGVFSAR